MYPERRRWPVHRHVVFVKVRTLCLISLILISMYNAQYENYCDYY